MADVPDVKAALRAGYDPVQAIRGALVPTMKQWAAERGFDVAQVSRVVRGGVNKGRGAAVKRALAEYLGLGLDELETILDRIRRERRERESAE